MRIQTILKVFLPRLKKILKNTKKMEQKETDLIQRCALQFIKMVSLWTRESSENTTRLKIKSS